MHAVAQQQAAAAAAALQQRQAWVIAQQAALAQNNKKQREVYVGNLTIGVVSQDMIKELFNSALTAAFPQECQVGPPVANVQLSGEGKYAFVELRTEDMATAAMCLDKVLLCGRELNVGRPKGYVDPGVRQNTITNALGALNANPSAIPSVTVPGVTQPTVESSGKGVLCLLNLVSAEALDDDEEFKEVIDDVKDECSKCGKVTALVIARSKQGEVATPYLGKIFVRFSNTLETDKAKALLHGRSFDGNKVEATLIEESDFQKAVQALGVAWGDASAPVQIHGPPGAGAVAPALTTVPAAPPIAQGIPLAQAEAAPTVAGLAAAANASLGPSTTYIKMRGLPFSVTKAEILAFFSGIPLAEEKVHIGLLPDGRRSGEAFVDFATPDLVRLGLTKDRAVLGTRYIELFTATTDEALRAIQVGVI
eukprot:scaffold1786_cov398-Prasinococcus_capsulatus_cf.AAC.26